MKRILTTLLASALLFATGCYDDFDTPAPATIYTDADFTAEGLSYISIKDLKAKYYAAHPGMNDGQALSLTITEPLFTRGKVLSSDRSGNIYKSVYLYDETSRSAIELKLTTGNYLFHPVGQIVYVKLRNLVVGNYRGMLSIGTTSADPAYANDNIETDILRREHIFSGEQQPMLPADTLVVTATDYRTSISDADLGRLVRFEGVQSKFGKAQWGFQNTFPNYFANSQSFDINSPGWEEFFAARPSWAAKRRMDSTGVYTFFFGSAWFTFGDLSGTQGQYTPGNYVVRSSGYCSFYANKIPADGTIVTLTAIYTKFTGSNGSNASYQLSLITDRDVIVQ